MNRWLCFYYDGNQNRVVILDLGQLGRTPAAYEDEIDEALMSALQLNETPMLNAFVDVSDLQDDAITVVVDGETITQFLTVRLI